MAGRGHGDVRARGRMTYFERSGNYIICSIGGPFGHPDAVYEAYFGKENLEVNLSSAEAAREVCRAHAKAQREAA